MADYVKENIRQTTGGGGGAASNVEIADGTAGGRMTVQPTITTVPTSTDNPALVRAIIGDEISIADVVALSSTGFDPDSGDITPGARGLLFTASVIYGARATVDDIRPASVGDGYDWVPLANDNPLYVSQGLQRTLEDQDGAPVAVANSTSVQVAAANPDRVGIIIQNPDATNVLNMRFAAACDATFGEIAAGGSFEMTAGGGIYTGVIHVFQTSGAQMDVPVYEW